MKNKITIFLIILLISSLLLASSCVNKKEIETEDDLLEIFIITKHINTQEYRDKVIKKYSLDTKEKWDIFREKLLELANSENIDDYENFKKKAVDYYINERDDDYLISYFKTAKYNRNFRFSEAEGEISEADMNTERVYKVFYIDNKYTGEKIYTLEYYEEGKLKKRLYKNDFSQSIKEETFEDDKIVTTLYLGLQ